jgi:chromosome segregation ATPase
MTELQAKLNAAGSEIERLGQQLSDEKKKSNEMTELQAKLNAAGSEIERLGRQLGDEKEKSNDELSAAQTERDTYYRMWASELQTSSGALKELQEKLGAADSRIERLGEQLSDEKKKSNDEIERLRRQLAEEKKKKSNDEIERLGRQLAEETKKSNEIKELLQTSKKEVCTSTEYWTRELIKANAKCKGLGDQVKESQRERDAAVTAGRSLSQQLESLKGEYEAKVRDHDKAIKTANDKQGEMSAALAWEERAAKIVLEDLQLTKRQLEVTTYGSLLWDSLTRSMPGDGTAIQ